MDSVFKVTVFTNLSLTLGDNVTLPVIDVECSVYDSECADDNDIIYLSYSFILNDTYGRAVIFKAHTDYYGADWYSEGKQVIHVIACSATSPPPPATLSPPPCTYTCVRD